MTERRCLRVAQVITRMIVGGAQENTFLTARDLGQIEDQAASSSIPVRTTLLAGPETGSEGSLWDEVRAASISHETISPLIRAVDPRQDWRAYRELRTRFGGGKFDLVHTHSSKAGILGRRAAARAGVPAIVHTVHGWPFHPGQSRALRQGYVALERRAARWADALVAVSEDDIESGLRLGIGSPEQYTLIRSGVDLERFGNPSRSGAEMRADLGLPRDAPVLGSVTRLSPQKAPLDLIELFAMVAELVPEAHFLLVGDGPLRGDVIRRIQEKSLTDRVVLEPLRRDVPELLTVLDLFALTSRWEGLPRTVPEALTAGVPVVALGVSGVGDLIKTGETGIVRDSGDLRGLAEDSARLLRDPGTRDRLGREGQRRAARFGGAEMIRQLAELYRRILLSKGWFRELDRVCPDP